MDITESFKNSRLFKNFSDKDIEALKPALHVRELNAGESLFFEGEDSNCLYFIAAGTLVIKKRSAKGDQDIANLGPGTHFGELAMLNFEGSPDKRSATAEAKEASKVVEINFTELEKILKTNSLLGLMFYRNISISLAGKIKKTTEDLSDLKAIRLRNS
jgi:CRP/FNR family cyclic AMP-dependent transcriptional regulator